MHPVIEEIHVLPMSKYSDGNHRRVLYPSQIFLQQLLQQVLPLGS